MNQNLQFIAVGPQKTATTWLHRVLSQHPQVALPVEKETYYFDRHFGEKPIDWLWWHYRNSTEGSSYGEIAPSYFHDPEVPERVRSVFPDCRIVVSVRNPVTRTFSLFRHHLAKNRVPADFWKAAAKLPLILDTGWFSQHLPRWEAAFGVDQLHIIVQEDIEANPGEVIDVLTRFLGVEPLVASPDLHVREGGMRAPVSPLLGGAFHLVAEQLRAWRLYGVVDFVRRYGAEKVLRGGEAKAPKLTPELYAEIYEKVEPEIAYLENRLGREFPEWRPPASAFG